MKWLLFVIFLSITNIQAENFVQTIKEAKSYIRKAKTAYKKEQTQKRKDPFYLLNADDKQIAIMSAHMLRGEVTPKEEDYILKEHRNNDFLYNYPAVDAPAIDALTKQVNKILQKLDTSPQVYELEAMYALSTINQSGHIKCERQNLGATEYTKNYTYDPKAMILLASQKISMRSIQIIHHDKKHTKEFYYRGVLNRKNIIVQITVSDQEDTARINIFSLIPITNNNTHKNKASSLPTLIKPSNKIGKLNKTRYKNGDFEVQGAFGLEYEHDKYNLPKNIKIWTVETKYKTENFNWSLTSRLDAKKQEIRTSVAKNNNKNNALELFVKGKHSGVAIKTQLHLGSIDIKGQSQYYKKIISGRYNIVDKNNVIVFNTNYAIDKHNKSEQYTIDRDLYKHKNKFQQTFVNIKYVKKISPIQHNQDAVWLTLVQRF